MKIVQLDIQTVVVGTGPVTSMILLKPHVDKQGKSYPLEVDENLQTCWDDIEPHYLAIPRTSDEGKDTSIEFDPSLKLPIRIGFFEAASIEAAINPNPLRKRPLSHNLLTQTIYSLGARVSRIAITKVDGPTFYAQIALVSPQGKIIMLDARPSDALALALLTDIPFYASTNVLKTAAAPDFVAVEKSEQAQEEEEFHKFIENLEPEDFALRDIDDDNTNE